MTDSGFIHRFISAPFYFSSVIPPPLLLPVWLAASFLGLATTNVFAQNPLIKAFQQISVEGKSMSYRNSFNVNTEGGHIQGVQPIRYQGHSYAILSGSSGTVSYYAVVQMDQPPHVISVDTLMIKPYKHAGGFQINDGLMAIGVEDNEDRNTSKVLIFAVANPERIPSTPLQVIERKGDFERATAGCVALAAYQQQWMLMVGDWNTRHLDIYTMPKDALSNNNTAFQLHQSITLDEHPRTHWIDEEWPAYQNINLLVSEDSLYLMGMGVNSQQENVADLYSVRVHPEAVLTKVSSRTFAKSEESSFVWGAGVDWQSEAGQMRILSTSRALIDSTSITVYR